MNYKFQEVYLQASYAADAEIIHKFLVVKGIEYDKADAQTFKIYLTDAASVFEIADQMLNFYESEVGENHFSVVIAVSEGDFFLNINDNWD